MNIHALKPNISKSRKRVGRGSGSGRGTFSGRGCKGQNSRAGGGVRVGFEGGQSGLLDRMPKLRGFRNPNRVETQTVSLAKIEESFKDGETVNLESLIDKKLIRSNNAKVKVLASGELKKKVKISAEILISATAKAAVEKAGGTVAEAAK